MYFLLINRTRAGADQAKLAEIIPPHVDWIKARMKEGVIVQSGKWGDIGGMVIFKADGEDEVRPLIDQDPLFSSDMVEWDLAEFWPMKQLV